MPKFKGKLFRRHESTPKSNKDSLADGYEKVSPVQVQELKPLNNNIFKGVFIPPEVLKQNLTSHSRKSVSTDLIDSKGHCNRRRKKVAFHEVIQSVKDFLKKREDAKKKAKKDILGNFQSLTAALPDLKELMEKKAKEDAKPRAAKRFSKQDAEMMEDLMTYQHILNNPEYKADPFGTVTDQLKQRLQSGSL